MESEPDGFIVVHFVPLRDEVRTWESFRQTLVCPAFRDGDASRNHLISQMVTISSLSELLPALLALEMQPFATSSIWEGSTREPRIYTWHTVGVTIHGLGNLAERALKLEKNKHVP